LATGKDLLPLPGHRSDVRSLAFSPDGKRLASRGRDHRLLIWDMASHRVTLSLRTSAHPTGGHVHSPRVRTVAFSPNGKLIAGAPTFDSDPKAGRLYLWDARTGKTVLSLREHLWAYALDLSPDGRTLAVALGVGKGVGLFTVPEGKPLRVLDSHTGPSR